MEALWSGYYIYHNGTWHTVVHVFGIWFELRRQEGAFKAFQVAHIGMELEHLSMHSLNQKAITLSGKEIPMPTQGPTPANDPVVIGHAHNHCCRQHVDNFLLVAQEMTHLDLPTS